MTNEVIAFFEPEETALDGSVIMYSQLKTR
jgi:hypothetical protein